MRRLAALLALLLLASCSNRARLNPLDSMNPNSGGAPEGFNALAGFVSVRLVWLPRPDLAIDGFRLYRLAPFDSLYRPLGGAFLPTSSSFFDGSASNGLDYRYRLFYVIDGQPSARYAEDVATPGSVRAWVGDVAGGRVLRLTPDARDIVEIRTGFGTPYSLAVTQDNGPVWVADDQAGEVQVLDPQGLFAPVTIAGVSDPFTMALDPFNATAWICDLSGAVRHYAANGTPAAPPALNVLFNQPGGIATNAADGAVWVTELTGNRVRRFARDGTVLGARPIASPSRVAVDSSTGEAWVTSLTTGRVWLLTPGMAALDSVGLQGPIGVALDWRRRTAWIADAAANQVVALDMDTRAERFRLVALGEPRDVAVDLQRGDAWVVGRTAASVYRFSATGVLLGRVGGLGEPVEVRLDRGFQ
jgi:DNA-binding beta-propeller fold protein YncE